MIPDIVKPYRTHPLVANKDVSDLEALDTPFLNNIIRSEDLMIKGIREFYLKYGNTRRLGTSQFSSSILIARGLAFLDVAHYKPNVANICDDVWKITPTTAKRPNFNKNMRESIIRRLDDGGLIEFDSDKQYVNSCIPYPIGSKLFVQKNLVETPRLLREQANHYSIIGGVQDFPELKSELEANSTEPGTFNRDYNALSEIDTIRDQEIGNRLYTFSTCFLAGEKSASTWLQLLSDTSDNYRIALKSLMELQGEFGGFISHQEIVAATGMKARDVNWLMRNIDNLGIAQRVHTLDMENALGRITHGTLLGMNYLELNNAQSILVLTRHVPEAVEMLNILQYKKELVEDDLTDKYENAIPVQKTINSLELIRLIKQKGINEGVWELTPMRGNKEFISDVLAVCARSRHVIQPDYDITNSLEEQYSEIDEAKFRKGTEQLKFDYFKSTEDEYRR